MSDVHDTAAHGFDVAADVYARARPGYPPDACDLIAGWLASPVIDLGAGTGKFTAELCARGLDVIAVEPVAGMRERFSAALPGVPILDGSAHAIPVADASAGSVVCAQAFHWFADARALAEMHRVLGPGRRLVLVWNVRDERVDWVAAITALIAPYEETDGMRVPRHRDERWRSVMDASTAFRPVAEAEFTNLQPMTIDGLVDRVASTSFIAVLPEAERARVEQQVRALPERFEALRAERFVFPYVTEAYAYETI